MKKIIDLAPKPSDAIKAMLSGLLNQKNNPKFVIDMSFFGFYIPQTDICYGCAATCTIIELSGVEEINNEYFNDFIGRSLLFDFKPNELKSFEDAIDAFRLGDIYPLFKFYELVEFRSTNFYWVNYIPELDLQEYNWEEQIPKINEIISILESRGI